MSNITSRPCSQGFNLSRHRVPNAVTYANNKQWHQTIATDNVLVVTASGAAVAGTMSCTGNATLGDAVTDAHTVNGTLAATNAITSSHATGGIGYATGAGGAVTQDTSRTTTVVLNKAPQKRTPIAWFVLN